MGAKEYFDKKYDSEHIKTVVDMKDLESLYLLMEEFAESELKDLDKNLNKKESTLNEMIEDNVGKMKASQLSAKKSGLKLAREEIRRHMKDLEQN